jgi:hypothetical protein
MVGVAVAVWVGEGMGVLVGRTAVSVTTISATGEATGAELLQATTKRTISNQNRFMEISPAKKIKIRLLNQNIVR